MTPTIRRLFVANIIAVIVLVSLLTVTSIFGALVHFVGLGYGAFRFVVIAGLYFYVMIDAYHFLCDEIPDPCETCVDDHDE